MQLFLLLTLFFSHEFYVSVTQIDFDKESQALEISLKVFTDDFEKVLETEQTGKLHLGSEEENPNANKLIETYLEETFLLEVNGVESDFVYLGKEVELDVTWCYLEVSDISELNTLVLQNEILFEVSDNQTNIVHVDDGEQVKSLLFNKIRTEGELIFSKN